MPAATADKCRSVLIVDDDRDIRETLAEVLEDDGFEVVTASGGREAMKALADFTVPPCLIVLDLMMPEMNGWEVLDALRADPALSSIPVAVVSAVANPQSVPKGVPFIKKPVMIEALLDTVRKYHP